MKLKNKIVHIILILFCLLFILPLLMIFSGSFENQSQLTENLEPVFKSVNSEIKARWYIIPMYPALKSYVEILFDSPEFFIMFWNSCKLVFPILLGQLIVNTPAAWGFARYDFKWKNTLFTLYIVLMLMPFQSVMVSNYIVLNYLKLLNTRSGIILPAIFSTLSVFIMYRFFKGIPKTVIEAARMDGAGEFQIFVTIGIPMGAPGIASAMVLGFLEYWSMIEQPLAFLEDKTLWPLSLYTPDITPELTGVYLVSSVIILIPPLLIFLIGQKYLEKGIQASGLKE
ncbi:carbohydrate ABC transporter permease [Sedimentibacter sp.]|uniref:carbohydrate ABC transporter permease n=1 Tax=Sedimentibacter sp. TaxID=1960295 RepID=UPI0028AD031A|nr:carbohydrate ABC transporter permease [Sedimentibacter sp.]